MRSTTAFLLALAVPLLLGAGCDAAPAGEQGASQEAPIKEVINPAGGPVTTPFSPIVRTGNLLFLSGVIGVDRESDEQGAGAETRRVLEGIRNRLAAADAGMEDLVKCTVFMVDMDDYQEMNAAYREFFPEDPPARSAVAVRALPAGAVIEIECIGAVE